MLLQPMGLQGQIRLSDVNNNREFQPASLAAEGATCYLIHVFLNVRHRMVGVQRARVSFKLSRWWSPTWDGGVWRVRFRRITYADPYLVRVAGLLIPQLQDC